MKFNSFLVTVKSNIQILWILTLNLIAIIILMRYIISIINKKSL